MLGRDTTAKGNETQQQEGGGVTPRTMEINEPASCVEGTETMDLLESCVKGLRPAQVNEAEQALLDRLCADLRNLRAIKTLGVSCETMPEHRDWTFGRTSLKWSEITSPEHQASPEDWSASTSRTADFRHFPHNRRMIDFSSKHGASCPAAITDKMLEFKARTVSRPDLDWLDDIEKIEEPPARVYRNTPIPKHAPPREGGTRQCAAIDPPKSKAAQLPQAARGGHFGRKAAQPDGRSRREQTGDLQRFLEFKDTHRPRTLR